jgi:alpha,alpha-trehalose-phosphate synthase [UDP-forming]
MLGWRRGSFPQAPQVRRSPPRERRRPGEELLALKSADDQGIWRERPASADHEAAEGRASAADPPWPTGNYDFVVAACRLPVDLVQGPDGEAEWRPSPGGLVSALEPVMREAGGAWVGWSGAVGDPPDLFEVADMHLVGVGLSADEISDFYEGFCNATLWPLYHDVIAPPEFRRPWWDAYVRVNQRFAEAVAEQAAIGATVWVNDYQLQLVPRMLREQRSDLRIGVFIHIPFPGYEIFAQLPWRRQIVTGLLGADLLGFQRHGDAANFLRACRQAAGMVTNGSIVRVPAEAPTPADEAAAASADSLSRRRRRPPVSRHVQTATLPISIDYAGFARLVTQDDVRDRAKEIRQALGEPDVVLLGIDRLDYTKGILHRLTAYGELLSESRFGSLQTVLVLVASPSRERVEQYRLLRDEVETMVGRINGDQGEVGYPPIHYLHQTYPADEMAALYLTADVMLVTSLRDGMNLVAKEYVACRDDETGALVLSEFTGAADELSGAFLVNPHDIEGMKDAIVRAATVPPPEARRRMRAMRRRVREFDVNRWAATFLDALKRASDLRSSDSGSSDSGSSGSGSSGSGSSGSGSSGSGSSGSGSAV